MLNNLIDRIKLPFRKEKELYFSLYQVFGFYPRTIAYYKVALMHKSLGHRATKEEMKALEGTETKRMKGEKKGKNALGKRLNNERLEFLGDAILDAVVGDVVYHRFQGKPEGFLTNARSKLVQRETLGRLAKEMGISKLILANGRGNSHNSYIAGNAFEALVGALYLDRGYEAVQEFWTKRVMERYLNVDKMAYKEVNFKSKLLEWAQKNRVNIEFRLESQSQDKGGSPKFTYTVMLEGVKGATSEGFSKKESQQHASEMTLKKLHGDTPYLNSIFAAKSERTKMDEDPRMVVPVVEDKSESIFVEKPEEKSAVEQQIDNLSLDDVNSETEETIKEDIIAKAEAEAYK